jgi:hypothetical protein
MSKASHVRSTSSVDRRSILAGAAGIAAAGVLPAAAAEASPIGVEPSALVLEHLRLIRGPADESDHAAGVRLGRLVEVDRQILDTPVRSWADVAYRAEVAAYWADEDWIGDAGDWLFPTFPADHPGMDDRSVAGLISAVFEMAKGGANV